MRVYWRASLFSYYPSDDGYSYDAYRATCYTFGHSAKKKTLRVALEQAIGEDLIEPKKKAWEKRQVAASDSRGLGFGWIEICKLSYRGRTLVSPEKRMEVFNLYAFEKDNVRLGYSEFLGKAAQYGRDKRRWISVGHAVKSFWEWLTS